MARVLSLPLFALLGLSFLLGVLSLPSYPRYHSATEAAAANGYVKRDAVSLLSNAERMARGLRVKSPRSLFVPSRTRALQPRTSNIPDTPYYIEVVYANTPDTIAGYLAVSSDDGSIHLVSTTSLADTYYAPGSVPSSQVPITTNSRAFGTEYPYRNGYRVSADDKEAAYAFSVSRGNDPYEGDYNDFDITDSPDLDITFAPSNVERKLYIGNTNSNLYGGVSADSINDTYQVPLVTESSLVYINFILQ